MTTPGAVEALGPFGALLLLALLVSPYVLVWLLFSVRRSLVRIANALEANTTNISPIPKFVGREATPTEKEYARRVSNSAFGR